MGSLRFRFPRAWLARLIVAVAVGATVVTSALGAVSPGRVSIAGGSCAAGSKPAIIAGTFKCLRVGSSCAAKYRVTYRRLGFSCVSGRLHKYVKPHKPPTTTIVVTTPAPAPPVYLTGHYVGTTSQYQPISFDVAQGEIQNMTSGDINASCSPSFSLSGGNLDVPSLSINGDGSFGTSWTYTGTLTETRGGNAGASATYTETNMLAGRVQGGIASGTVKEDSSFELFSVGYVCSSGLVTWTATLTP